jgi:hypothetical protein
MFSSVALLCFLDYKPPETKEKKERRKGGRERRKPLFLLSYVLE